MKSNASPRPPFPQWLAARPLPLLLGICCGFLSCCLAGRWTAQQPLFQSFVRFHAGIAPETHFYPTYSQTLALAREQLQPGKTLVIVGGNSVLQGVGQRRKYVWTKALQAELGDEYIVLNLAMRAAFPNEFASLVAERLKSEGERVIYLTAAPVTLGWTCDWDGLTYRSVFWDAWGKGLLPAEERRDHWLAQDFYTKYADDEPMQELRRRGLVDGVVYAQDLWTYVAYKHFGTVWSPRKGFPIWTPHRLTTDNDRGDLIPFARRFPDAHIPIETRLLRNVFSHAIAVALARGQGQQQIVEAFEAFLPQHLRSCSLYIFRTEATYYLSRLTPEERQKYTAVYTGFQQALEAAGLHTVLAGIDYVDEDYHDRSHFSESGGRKLARDVAPAIRALKEQLYGATRTAASAGAAP